MRLAALAALLVGCAGKDPCEGQDEEVWFEDRDRDGFGSMSVAIRRCEPDLPAGWVANNDDCDDLRAAVFPGATELCDGVDNNCNFSVDEGLEQNDWFEDRDQDGFGDAETRVTTCFVPPDGSEVAGDCNDFDPTSYPGAPEICDGLDNDCDGVPEDEDPDLIDSTAITAHPDVDGDGFGDGSAPTLVCELPEGMVLDDSDCDDENALVNPAAIEFCDGVDNDCDALTDDSDPSVDPATQLPWYLDDDQDGFGDPDAGFLTCTEPWFHVRDATDCDDSDPTVGSETETVWLFDADGDGVGAGDPSLPSCLPPGPNWVSQALGVDCDDADPARSPLREEVCDLVDNDCDALVDTEDPSLNPGTANEYIVDGDGDGFGGPAALYCAPPANVVASGGDCNDEDPLISPDADEICSGVDDNCNGLVDDADPFLVRDDLPFSYVDADGDGWGDPTGGAPFCVTPLGWTDNQSDCDDDNPLLGPPTFWWEDADDDGFGLGPTVGPTCTPPDGFVRESSGADCDDDAPEVSPGAFDACGDGLDADCDGEDAFCPLESCLDLLAAGFVEDGVYSIDPGDGRGPKDVWCDQTTDGGGWTLVVSTSSPVDDEAQEWSATLRTLSPVGTMTGIWDGLRPVIPANSDIRFSCKTFVDDPEFEVDLVFYDIHWYNELTSGADEDVCFNEDDGLGYDQPAPARRNLITGQFRAEGNPWDAGYLEGEDFCESRDDFTIDFDDRGMDSNQFDGTDWGEDDELVKCGVTNAGEAWFMWVR